MRNPKRDWMLPTLIRLGAVLNPRLVVRWLVAAAPLLIGLGTLFVSFIFIFPGIPYQDPTPAVQAEYNAQLAIASRIVNIGLLITAVGALWFLANGLYYVVRGRRT